VCCYSDEFTVFLNGQPLFTGRGAYRYRAPGFLGVMDVEDGSVYLNLKKGRNEIVLVVAEYFGGWGFICRIDDPQGIKLERSRHAISRHKKKGSPAAALSSLHSLMHPA
jgi:hypothetical protein